MQRSRHIDADVNPLGADETTYLALTMHEINDVETATGKAKAAGAA